MEKIRSMSETLEKQVAMLKLRFWGSLFFQLVLLGVIIFFASRTEYIAIDPMGNVYSSKKIERTDPEILLIEADAHARSFYNTMWTFNHLNRRTQITKAGQLGGNVIRDIYKALQQKSYYKEIEANNYYVYSQIDSVNVREFRIDGSSLQLVVYGQMTLENDRYKEVRDLDIQLTMTIVGRVREINPNGLSIEGINILTNETLESYDKQ
jgi:hypothetical protein